MRSNTTISIPPEKKAPDWLSTFPNTWGKRAPVYKAIKPPIEAPATPNAPGEEFISTRFNCCLLAILIIKKSGGSLHEYSIDLLLNRYSKGNQRRNTPFSNQVIDHQVQMNPVKVILTIPNYHQRYRYFNRRLVQVDCSL
jgi:hypothetical protein